MNLFIQFIPSQKKNDNKTKKNPEAHCQIYIKKNVEGEKLKNKNNQKKPLTVPQETQMTVFTENT